MRKQWKQVSQILEYQQTPHISFIMGELWGVYCDDLGENCPRYNGAVL